MPGLLGAISMSDNPVDSQLASTMLNGLRHKDWYTTTNYFNPSHSIFIGHVHLNIVNKQPQPYQENKGKLKLFLHGEIYPDTPNVSNPLDYIYRMYLLYGYDFCAHLNGSFFIVIIDEDKNEVLLATDHIAGKPVFYTQIEQTFYFAPEIKSLLKIPGISTTLYQPAIADFLTNGHFTADHTLIPEIKKLDKATLVSIKPAGINYHRYWEFSLDEHAPDKGKDYYIQQLSDLVRRAIANQLTFTDQDAILLSGGYDSRGILGFCLEQRPPEHLKTLSWGRAIDIPDSDCLMAKNLTTQHNIPWEFYYLSGQEILDNFKTFVWLGEGLTDFPESYEVFEQIRTRQQVNVVLRGDECFGTSRFKNFYDETSMLRFIDMRLLRYIPTYRQILTPNYFEQFVNFDDQTRRQMSARCSLKSIYYRHIFFYLDTRLKYYLNSLNYVKTFSIESFNPLLDREILDFICTVPQKYFKGRWLWINTIKTLFPELIQNKAQQHNMIEWPDALRESPKTKAWIYQTLLEKPSQMAQFINRPALKEMLDAFYGPPVPATAVQHWRQNLITKITALPALYSIIHAGSHTLKKYTGATNHDLPLHRMILRLLILFTWEEVFLTNRENPL